MVRRTLPTWALIGGLGLIIQASVSFAAIPAKDSLGNIQNILKELRSHRHKRSTINDVQLTPPRIKKRKSRRQKVQKFRSNNPKSSFKQPTKRIRQQYVSVDQHPSFDIPVTYNSKVKQWINYFQTNGHKWFKKRLERSHKYLPKLTQILSAQGLPRDLAYIAMVESGFSARAVSHASAVGYWQFIKPTANRYGLRTSWWLDERRDFTKSTSAAGLYLADLYKLFGSWYLSAAAYNMGETRMRRLIKKHGTKDFWALSKKRDFPRETRDYIPKIIAAMLIAKAPRLYGFRNIKPQSPYSYEYFNVPGGTDLHNLASYLAVKRSQLRQLNPELIKGFVPKFVKSHRIRIPKGHITVASQFVRKKL